MPSLPLLYMITSNLPKLHDWEDVVPATIVGEDVISSFGDDKVGNVYTGITKISPVDGSQLAHVLSSPDFEMDCAIDRLQDGFKLWRMIPAPRRGELVRLIGNEFRANKDQLAQLITIEVGKNQQEAMGEVQEVIDTCDFAVGLSRQLAGLTLPSERPMHQLLESWHPMGIVGLITAFNFPLGVWAWNTMLAFVCGDTVIWKPSEQTPLCALACHGMVMNALRKMPDLPTDIHSITFGNEYQGSIIARSKKIPIVSATGSEKMGQSVGSIVAHRFGRSILELGGNNAIILAPSADMDLALRSITFAAVGTSGQRCTSLRRLLVHESMYDDVWDKLTTIYQGLRSKVGDPRDASKMIGPLIDERSFSKMQEHLNEMKDAHGLRIFGGERITDGMPNGFYVMPALVRCEEFSGWCQDEVFAPIMHVIKYRTIEHAIEINNSVRQGLSSAIFTDSVREAKLFTSVAGSDCGIANVNVGTSGAEIGGAFGGDKSTGGGRESGSDAWKGYMRRQTITINYGTELPLSQGIKFDV